MTRFPSPLVVAPATAPGGSIAIVRASGDDVRGLVRAIFRPGGEGPIPDTNTVRPGPVERPRRAMHGRFLSLLPAPGHDSAGSPNAPRRTDEPIDDGLCIFFPGPRSFTGEDVAEFHLHGNPLLVRALLASAFVYGARLAEPGEFTRRAFLAGRIDLARAEAVGELIAAETERAARAARARLAGGLSRRIEAIREGLVLLGAEIEARIDFPDEDTGVADRARLDASFADALAGVESLLATRRAGRLLSFGARVAIVGPPNVGKSSLLNALAREERAIVTPHPGTTRDTIECRVDLRGFPVTFVDTAGIRASEDPVERIGIERGRRALEDADLVLEVRDATGEIPPLEDLGRLPDLIALNKVDALRDDALSRPAVATSPDASAAARVVRISARTGEGIEALEARLAELLAGGGDDSPATPEPDAESSPTEIVVAERHAALLDRARSALLLARETWSDDAGGELAMVDLREALAALDEILGRGSDEAILDAIFSRFCLGK